MCHLNYICINRKCLNIFMATSAYIKRMAQAIQTKTDNNHIFIEDSVKEKIFNKNYFQERSLQNLKEIRYEYLVDIIFQTPKKTFISYKKTNAIKKIILGRIKKYIFNTLIMQHECITTHTRSGATYSCQTAENSSDIVKWFDKTKFANDLDNSLPTATVESIRKSSTIKDINPKVVAMNNFLAGQLGSNGAGYKELKNRVQKWPQLPQKCIDKKVVWPGPMLNIPLVYDKDTQKGDITKIYTNVYRELHPKTWPTKTKDHIMFKSYNPVLNEKLSDKEKKAMYEEIIRILKDDGAVSQGRSSSRYHQYVAVEF